MRKTLLKYYSVCFKEQGILKTSGNHTHSFISCASFNFIIHNIGFIYRYNQDSLTLPDDFLLLLKPVSVNMELYDTLDRKVQELILKYKPSGKYEINFDASGLTSGVYFLMLIFENIGDIIRHNCKIIEVL
jgi:hypothetical protein